MPCPCQNNWKKEIETLIYMKYSRAIIAMPLEIFDSNPSHDRFTMFKLKIEKVMGAMDLTLF